MAQTIDFVSLLHKSQEYISENYAAALSDRSKIVQLRSYIEKYLHDSGFEVEGMTFRDLADKLYSEMAEYSVLTKYLGGDEIEEININGWDDIAVTYRCPDYAGLWHADCRTCQPDKRGLYLHRLG